MSERGIPNDPTSLHDVVWVEGLAPPTLRQVPLEEGASYDLAVVGGGLAGVSVALHAARGGISVVLLERGTVGCGASGRNAGFVVPHYPGVSPARVEQLLGAKRGEALNALVAGGGSFVFDQIRDLEIDCAAVQNGWLQTAHSEKSAQTVQGMLKDWRAFGAAVEYVDTDAVAEQLGTRVYRDGWLVPSGGYVNPYALTVGLAEVACRHGAVIHEHTEVTSMREDAKGYLLRTPAAGVLAQKVLVATNGYTGGAWGALTRATVSIRLYTSVSRALTSNLQQQVLPARRCVSDLHAAARFTRIDERGRLVCAGMSPLHGDVERIIAKRSEQVMAETYPFLTEPRMQQFWEGYCAFTATALPNLYRLGAEAFAIAGFSGRGVLLAQTLGPVLADFLTGNRDEAELPLPVVEPRADPLASLKSRVAPVVYSGLELMDRFGLS